MEAFFPIFVIIIMLFELAFWVLFIKFIIFIIKSAIRKNNYRLFKQDTIPENTIITSNYNDLSLSDLIRFRSKVSDIYKDNFRDVSSNKLDLFNVTDINILKDYFYNIFLKFEESLNKLDYQQLKLLCSDQLYENYYTGIDLDIKNGYKRIIDNIEKKKMIIYELDSTIAKQVVSTLIEIKYVNYTVNNEGKVVKGSKNPITEKFVVKFRKDFKQTDIKNCPNCGAPVNNNTKCPYCETKLTNTNEFKIYSIQRIV